MNVFEVLKWEVSTAELAHCSDSDGITLGSQLVVYPSQTAFLVKGGAIVAEYGPGTHTIQSENVPIAGRLVNKPFGGTSPFQAQVWWVNGISILDAKWGTQAPIQIEDPKYGVIVPLRAYGQYGFRISRPRVFLERFVGNMSSFATSVLAEYFRGVILSKLTNIISEKLYADSLSVVNINSHLGEISEYACRKLRPTLDAYGVDMEMFQVIGISVNDNDPSFKRLKETKDALARINIMGTDNYRLERSFNVLDAAATNDSGLAGAAAGIGAGLGIGRQVAAVASVMTTDTPPPLSPEAGLQYYLGISGRSEGPLDKASVESALCSGRINGSTLIWHAGMSDWRRIADMAEFACGSAPTPPPLPQI